MGIEFEIKLPGIFTDANNVYNIYQAKLSSALRLSLQKIASEVKKRTPVNTGALANSISWNDNYSAFGGHATSMSGSVFTPLQYGVSVEYGTAPHWAPIMPLKLWAKRVLGDEGAAYAIQKAIARRGTRGRFMFRIGMQFSKQSVDLYFKAAVKSIVGEWSKLKGRIVK